MPELPEVETIRKQLSTVLKGRIIKKIDVLRNKSFIGNPDVLKGWVVDDIGRKAKVLEIYFKGKNDLVIVHLKMTGQIVFADKDKRTVGGHPTSDWVNALPSKHTRVIWTFKDGSMMYFNDMRVFGWMKLVKKDTYEIVANGKPPDVTDKEFNFEYLKRVLSGSSKAVKLILVDQEKIGGVGNIYANDALFLARVMPTRSANTLNDIEVKRLEKSLKKVISLGIKYGGSSAADEKYVDIFGLSGKYQEHFLVYERKGQGCPRCGAQIEKIRLGGRGTYYCQICQK